jgi:hypothetical protein
MKREFTQDTRLNVHACIDMILRKYQGPKRKKQGVATWVKK